VADGAFTPHQAGFRATLNDEPQLVLAIRRAFWMLHRPEARLARDGALDALAAALNSHFGASTVAKVGETATRVARRARDLLREQMEEDMRTAPAV
jgi:hypothetical protein